MRVLSGWAHEVRRHGGTAGRHQKVLHRHCSAGPRSACQQVEPNAARTVGLGHDFAGTHTHSVVRDNESPRWTTRERLC